MGWSWDVTSEARERVVRDAFRAQLRSEQSVLVAVYLLLIMVLGGALLGPPGVLGGLIPAVVAEIAILLIWRRQLRRGLETTYPDGFRAESELVGERLRLVDAVATTEVGVAHLRRPRVLGTVVTVVKPGARLRRTTLPAVLVPAEVLARLS